MNAVALRNDDLSIGIRPLTTKETELVAGAWHGDSQDHYWQSISFATLAAITGPTGLGIWAFAWAGVHAYFYYRESSYGS